MRGAGPRERFKGEMDRPGAVHPELIDWERKLDHLREHFGPSWSWLEMDARARPYDAAASGVANLLGS
jgi:hypothetical protein